MKKNVFRTAPGGRIGGQNWDEGEWVEKPKAPSAPPAEDIDPVESAKRRLVEEESHMHEWKYKQ